MQLNLKDKKNCKFDDAKNLRSKIAIWFKYDSANLELLRTTI